MKNKQSLLLRNKQGLLLRNKILLLLLLITLLGGLFRFWKLSSYPVSLTIDEVAVGYDSYSILKTSRDSFGDFLPLSFRSIGDYKSPALFYLMAPSILVFGLNEFGVRFVIAFLGTLTIPLVYFLIFQLTKNRSWAFFSAFSLAISPWHINFSRWSYDAMVALFFILLGTWLFLRGLERKGQLLWLGGAFFVFSSYAYHAEKLFAPILFLGLLIIFRKELLKNKTALLKMLVIMFIIAMPLINLMMGIEGQRRMKMTFIGQDENISYLLHNSNEKLNLNQKIFDNNFIILGNFWIKRYLNYWDPSFLFFKGMNFSLPGAPDSGIFYFFELPFFLLGLWLFFFKGVPSNKKIRYLIIFWLLVGPLPASLTNNEQHSGRSLIVIPALQFLIALGAAYLWNYLGHINIKKRLMILIGSLVIIVINIIYVADLYFVHSPIQFSEYYDYGMKEASLFAWAHKDEYKEIVVDNIFGTQGPYIVGTPHLYMLFYGKYDPRLLQTERRIDLENFDKFKFRTIYWPEDRFKENTLFIGSPWRLPLKDIDESQILKRIYFKNGQLGWLIVRT